VTNQWSIFRIPDSAGFAKFEDESHYAFNQGIGIANRCRADERSLHKARTTNHAAEPLRHRRATVAPLC
jgi:hypothetical protein